MAVQPEIVVTPAAAGSTEPWPSPARAWYAIFVFALALMMNFLDRGIVALLIPPLEQDLHLTDDDIGLITGFYYVIFYAIIGLPIARFADIGVRRTIVGIGITIWSLATAFCGLASNFWQLALARAGVGAGEACNGPPVFSMISDLFPRDRLPLAIAVLNFGFIAGNGIASIAGGSVIAALKHTPIIELPLLGALHWWQVVFIAVGLPGLIVAILIFLLKEPSRRGRVAKDGVHVNPPISQVARFFFANWRSYVPMFAALAFNIVPFVGLLIWGPTYIFRRFGMQPEIFGIYAGVLALCIGPFGAVFGGWFAGHLQRKGYDSANLIIVALSFGINLVTVPTFLLAPTLTIAFIAYGAIQFFSMWVPGPFNAALQVVTPNEMRSQITALFLFVFNIIGFGLGPSIVPQVTMYLFNDPSQIGMGLAAVVGLLVPLATISILIGIRPYGAAVARERARGG